MAAILLSRNIETAATLVFQWIYIDAGHVSKNAVYRVIDVRGEFGERERSFLNALETSQVYPWLDKRTAKSMNQFFYNTVW